METDSVQLHDIREALQKKRPEEARRLARQLLRDVSGDPALQELRFRLMQLCIEIDSQLLSEYEAVEDDLLARFQGLEQMQAGIADVDALMQARKKLRDGE